MLKFTPKFLIEVEKIVRSYQYSFELQKEITLNYSEYLDKQNEENRKIIIDLFSDNPVLELDKEQTFKSFLCISKEINHEELVKNPYEYLKSHLDASKFLAQMEQSLNFNKPFIWNLPSRNV
ncbi:MAG: hypothetical protein PHD83_00085 [Caldisericia bacterium]|nr:hypothetical protein [Caldisericia bacterium]